MASPFLSVKDFAQVMNVSIDSVKWWISQNYVPHFTIGRRRFIDMRKLDEAIEIQLKERIKF